MKKITESTDKKHHAPEEDRIPYPVIGRIAHVDNLTEIWVTFDGNAPVQARLLSSIDRAELSKKENIGREVLLMFDRGKKGEECRSSGGGVDSQGGLGRCGGTLLQKDCPYRFL